LIYISNPDLQPLQIILRTILIQNQVDLSTMMDVNSYAARVSMIVLLKNALIVVASMPVLILYPFVQKYFVKGIMIGAIKG
jgi:putative aldouronate transport system permease protein